MKILIAQSREAPPELVRPVSGAIGVLDGLELHPVDLGRMGETGSRLGRVVQAIMGEDEAKRLMSALVQVAPAAAVAFDPGALAALVLARDRRIAATPAIGVVPDLAPRALWAVHADRYAVIDDEAAVALSELGVDGARVVVTGPILPRALYEASLLPRAALRTEFKLPADMPVVLVDTRGLTLEVLNQLALQLSLFDQPLYLLFDAGGSVEVAALLRKQVPALGLRGKLFGETENAPKLWRTADVIVGRPTPRAIHAALGLGARLLAIEIRGADEEREVQALTSRRLGAGVAQLIVLLSALEPLLRPARKPGAPQDGAAEVARLIADVAANKDAVLVETFATAPSPPASEDDADEEVAEPEKPIKQGAAGDLEDLDEGAPTRPTPRHAAPELDALRRKVAAAEARAQKELDASRIEAERWEQRKLMADAKGDVGLSEQAAREADRKRARMHTALEELGRLAVEKARLGGPASPSTEDPLRAFKEQVRSSGGAASKPKSVDDQLAELKRRMESDPGRGRKR